MRTDDKKVVLNSEVNEVERQSDELLEEIEEAVTASALGCSSCCG